MIEIVPPNVNEDTGKSNENSKPRLARMETDDFQNDSETFLQKQPNHLVHRCITFWSSNFFHQPVYTRI